MKQKEKISVEATLSQKYESKYFPIPGRIPWPTEMFEIEFSTATGTLNFEVDFITYGNLAEGDQGTLVYQGNDIISFADKIHEFNFEE